MDDSFQKPVVSSPARQFRFGLCHLASSWHVSCSVCKQLWTITYGFPWLTAQSKRAVDEITIQAATLNGVCLRDNDSAQYRALALCVRGARRSALRRDVLLVAIIRGATHVQLGAHRGAFYTCEIAKRWGVSHLNKAGSLGVLSNFRLPVSCAAGWPRISESREYRGPLSAKCSCGAQQESIKSQKASSPAIHATVCAEFLTALHRLPEEKGELNTSCSNGLGNAVFSPVQDADSPALFLLSGQPWQQALLRSFSEQPDDVCTMKVLPVTKECEKELKRKLSDQVGGKEQTKSSRSEGSGVGVVGRRAGGGGFGAAGQSSSTVAKMVAKGVKRLASDVFTEARGSQLGKCGVARAVEPIRAELSSNLSECECPRPRARPS